MNEQDRIKNYESFARPNPLPKTLAEACQITARDDKNYSFNGDQTLYRLRKLKEVVNASFKELAVFTEQHNLGLALNKLSNIEQQLQEIINTLESKVK